MNSTMHQTGLRDVQEIVSRVQLPGKDYRVGTMDDGYFVQITYWEPDIHTGEMDEQHGRKWYVSGWATESEVVQTCFAAAMASAEHQVREHFGYRPTADVPPRAIFGPHFSSEALYGICGKAENYDARDRPT